MSTVAPFLLLSTPRTVLFPGGAKCFTSDEDETPIQAYELRNNPWALLETKGENSQLPNDSNISCPPSHRGKGKLTSWNHPSGITEMVYECPFATAKPRQGIYHTKYYLYLLLSLTSQKESWYVVARSCSLLGDRGNAHGSALSCSASWNCLIDKKLGKW